MAVRVAAACFLLLLFQSGLWILAATATNKDEPYDFDHMSRLIKRLDVLEDVAPDTLLGFYEPQLNTFSARPENVGSKKRVCVTSTCYALLTLTLGNAGGVYDDLLSLDHDDTTDNRDTIPIRQVMKPLIASSWRKDDLFQVPLLLYTILKVDSDRSLIRKAAASDKDSARRIQKLISAVLKARPHRHSGIQQDNSDYIIYQVCKVCVLLQEALEKRDEGLPSNVLPDDAASEIFWALLRCAEGMQSRQHIEPLVECSVYVHANLSLLHILVVFSKLQ